MSKPAESHKWMYFGAGGILGIVAGMEDFGLLAMIAFSAMVFWAIASE